MATPIWKSFAPLKCKIFGWLATKYKLWTADRRTRHGLQDETSACFTCLQEEDTVDHVLMQCVYAREVWTGCLHQAGLVIEGPQQDSNLETRWLTARSRVQRVDKRTFDTFTILTAWMLWNQRNERVFGNGRMQCGVVQLIDRIKDEFEMWMSVARGERRIVSRE